MIVGKLGSSTPARSEHECVDRITVDLVDDLALGASLLAAGGGAPPWPAVQPLRAALVEHGPVPVLAVTDLEPDAFVLPIGLVGGSVPAGPDIGSVVAAAERRSGRRCAAVLPLEIGGITVLAASLVAAVLGLPCLDADGSRRSFSRLDLSLFGLGGLPAAPAMVCDGTGNLVTVDSMDNRAVDRLSQAAAADLGGNAVIGAYPMTAAECAGTAALGSLRYCAELGQMARRLGESDALDEADIARWLAAHGVTSLFTGRIAQVTGNSTHGTATVESTSGPARSMRVDFQYANLVASQDGVVCTTVPDLITMVDPQTWTAARTDQFVPRQPVRVLAIPADDGWRGVAGITAAGPRRFGYDIDYQPLPSRRFPWPRNEA